MKKLLAVLLLVGVLLGGSFAVIKQLEPVVGFKYPEPLTVFIEK